MIWTYVSQNLPPEQFAGLEPLQSNLVLGDSLRLSVDTLKRVRQVDSRNRRLRDGALHLFLLGLEAEWLCLLSLLVPLLVFAYVAE